MEKKNRPIISEEQVSSLNTEAPRARDMEVIAPGSTPDLKTEVPPRIKDDVYQRKQFYFTGEWVADEDPLKIGEKNYSTLQNYRYRNVGIEGVAGYTKINTTALTVNLKGRSAIQFPTPYTVGSYVLAQAENAAETASKVWENRGVVPAQTDFEATALWDDDADAGLGRFSLWPQGHVAYSNEKESAIWGGLEKIVNAFILASAAITDIVADAEDHTDIMQNDLSDTDNVATVSVAGSTEYMLIGSTRPLQGVKFYVSSANGSASSLSATYWTGAAWAAVPGGAPTDGTSVGGKALAQTGMVTWNSTEATAKVKFLEGRLLYWYQVILSAGSAGIYQVTLNAEMQSVKDIWDGVFRVPSQCQILHHQKNVWVDYTMNAYVETPAGWYPTDDGSGGDYGDGNMYPGYYIPLQGLHLNSPLQVGFEEPVSGIRVNMLATTFGFTNHWTAGDAKVKYWNGSAWTPVSSLVDETKDLDAGATRPYNRSGVLSWTSADDETPKSDFGSVLYYYQVSASPQLSTAANKNVWADVLRGIPAPKTFAKGYKFPFMFQGRAMLCGLSGQKNRIDYSMSFSPDVWNGDDSSFGPYGPLYFGGDEELTGGVQVYNRFGSTIYNTAIICKKQETYLLDGYDFTSWKIYRISDNLGCPAPLTMATAEVGYEVGEGATRNIAIWLSHAGPVIFDAGVLFPFRDKISVYFDPQDARCINFSYIEKSTGWVDSTKQEYNLLIPSGSAQTTNNVWLVFDLIRRRWFEKKPTAASNPYPQASVRVVDTGGAQYNYGFRDNGYMMRLENGTTWDGADITQKVVTADQVPTGDMWDETQVRRVKLIAESVIEASTTTDITLYKDGQAAGTALTALLLTGANRHVRATQAVGGMSCQGWSYAFEFETATAAELKGAPLLGWGYTFKVLREDE